MYGGINRLKGTRVYQVGSTLNSESRATVVPGDAATLSLQAEHLNLAAVFTNCQTSSLRPTPADGHKPAQSGGVSSRLLQILTH